jgi:hypothetical protein
MRKKGFFMSERHWPRPALATTALALLGATAVAGCGGGSSASKASAPQSAGAATATAATATAAAATKAFTAAQLKTALLTKVSGQAPATPAQAGEYGALPDVKTSKQTMNGVKVKPAKCGEASVTGFNSALFTHAPASVVTFRVGRDGVSEVLVTATPQIATTAMGDQLPAGCTHYSATVGGRTFHYTVKETALSGVGQSARALNVKAAGYSQVDVWSVVYQADGFVGAVTMVGPDSSKAGVQQLATQAYDYANQSLG